jgi:precorrin-6B methylase 2
MQTLPLAEISKQFDTLRIAERCFESAALFALFELGVFKALAGGPQTFQQLHRGVGGDLESLQAALNAAVALKVLTKENDRYGAHPSLVECLGREDSPAYLGDWVAFLHAVASPLMSMGSAIRTGKPIETLFEDVHGDSAASRRMTKAMHTFARTRGIEMIDRVDFSQTRRLLDLGCGPGTYSLAIVQRCPQVHATLLDLPGPIEEAQRIVAERGMTGKVELVAADAFRWDPPEPFDTILVSNILHMLGPDLSQKLLHRACGFLAPGGRLIVQAQFLSDDLTSPRWPTLLNLMMLVGTDRGRNHAFGETAQWMRQAGFTDVQLLRMSPWNVNSCLIGYKPRA